MQENCKGPPEGPRVTLCGSREQVVETLQSLSAYGGDGMQSTLFFHAQERTYLLRIEDVRFFTGRNHKVYATLRDGTELKSVTLRVTTAEFLKPLLKIGTLLHIARTTYVNPACVRIVEAKRLYLDDGTALNISRNNYQSTLAALERMAMAAPQRQDVSHSSE